MIGYAANPQLDERGELRTKPLPGYCKGCIVEKLRGCYALGLCAKCLAIVPSATREALRQSLTRAVPIEREPETRRSL